MTNKKEYVNNQLNLIFLQIESKDCNLLKSVLKCLRILKIKLVTGVFFYKNHILRLTQINNAMTNLGVNYISLMVKPIHGNVNVVIKNQFNDDNGRIFILEVTINDTEYLLVNIYNGNTEQEQLKTLQNVSVMLENFDSFCGNNMIIVCDFNLFPSKKLECKSGDL